MKILLLGGMDSTRAILKQLIGSSRHTLHRHRPAEDVALDARAYDLVLVDDTPVNCAANARLLELLQRIRTRAPQVPIVVLSPVNGAVADGGLPTCGVSRSDDGMAHVHCRLRELAWSETAGLLRATLERPPMEPVVFIYQG